MPKKLKKIAVIAVASLLLLFILFLLFRSSILTSVIDKKIENLKKSNISVEYKSVSFSGISSIYVTGFSFGEKGSPPVVKFDSLNVSLAFFPMLTGNINVDALYAGNIHIFMLRNDSICNYSFLSRSDSVKADDTLAKPPVDYRKFLSGIIDELSELSPDEIVIKNVYIGFNSSGRYSAAVINDVLYDSELFRFNMMSRKGKDLNCMLVAGRVDESENLIFAKAVTGKGFTFPFIDVNYDIISGFDTAVFRINYTNEDNLVFCGYGSLDNFFIRNERIAPDTVFLPPVKCNLKFTAGSNFLELDSATSVEINKLTFSPYICYTRDSTKKIDLKIKTGEIKADDLFSSLPANLFTTLSGIKTKGNVRFSLNFRVDLSQPDSLILDAEFKRINFRIERFGNVNYSFINEPFTHSVYEKGSLFRTFEVGPANPYFTPYFAVSPHLVNAILCTEDGGFFQHRGFIPEAFRESAATNIKEKRFARGGSTLTMQLVKNVYLNRNKNIARKVEEMLIVWLIENNGLVSKERMLEVYLNIIEWGPGIYGVGEAADYYFGKKPASLSIDESIFLASIIPMPKWFKSKLQPDGNLSPDEFAYLQLIRKKMATKSMIQPADTVVQNIIFRPELIKSVFFPDTIEFVPDTIESVY